MSQPPDAPHWTPHVGDQTQTTRRPTGRQPVPGQAPPPTGNQQPATPAPQQWSLGSHPEPFIRQPVPGHQQPAAPQLCAPQQLTPAEAAEAQRRRDRVFVAGAGCVVALVVFLLLRAELHRSFYLLLLGAGAWLVWALEGYRTGPGTSHH